MIKRILAKNDFNLDNIKISDRCVIDEETGEIIYFGSQDLYIDKKDFIKYFEEYFIGFYLVVDGDKCGLFKYRDQITPVMYDKIFCFDPSYASQIKKFLFYINGQEGLIDENGKIIFEAGEYSFSDSGIEGNLALRYDESNCDLIDDEGNVIIKNIEFSEGETHDESYFHLDDEQSFSGTTFRNSLYYGDIQAASDLRHKIKEYGIHKIKFSKSIGGMFPTQYDVKDSYPIAVFGDFGSGIIFNPGEEIKIPQFEVTDISLILSDLGFYPACSNGLWGAINKDLELVFEFEFTKKEIFNLIDFIYS